MVLWTEFAECATSGLAAGCTLTTTTFGNMVALMTLAVEETNTACKRSFTLRRHLHIHHVCTDTRARAPPLPTSAPTSPTRVARQGAASRSGEGEGSVGCRLVAGVQGSTLPLPGQPPRPHVHARCSSSHQIFDLFTHLCCANADTASGVTTKLKLVHYYRESTYVESSLTDTAAYGDALTALKTADDGAMDNVHALRATHAADIVAMVIGTGGTCGLANLGPGIDKMFSVTRYSCATGYFSFGHEIGHNLGLDHDRGATDKCISTVWDGVVKPIDHLGYGPFTAESLQECEGDCDSDSDCAGELYCYLRNTGGETPGCSGNGAGDTWDYCSHPALLYGNDFDINLDRFSRTQQPTCPPRDLCCALRITLPIGC